MDKEHHLYPVFAAKLGDEEVPPSDYDIHTGKSIGLAASAIISEGLTIGNGVIVKANTFVNKDIPDYSIVARAPTKIVGDIRNL